jgi:hypothetical protein
MSAGPAGVLSIPGVYGGLLDKIPFGAAHEQGPDLPHGPDPREPLDDDLLRRIEEGRSTRPSSSPTPWARPRGRRCTRCSATSRTAASRSCSSPEGELLHRDALVERVLRVEQQGQGWLRSTQTSTVATSRTSSWSATAETGRFTGSSTRKETLRSSGISAPRQRRGRNGLIGVSATRLEPERQDRPLRGKIVGGGAGRRRHQHAVADQLRHDDAAVDRHLDPGRLPRLAQQRHFVDRGLVNDRSPLTVTASILSGATEKAWRR